MKIKPPKPVKRSQLIMEREARRDAERRRKQAERDAKDAAYAEQLARDAAINNDRLKAQWVGAAITAISDVRGVVTISTTAGVMTFSAVGDDATYLEFKEEPAPSYEQLRARIAELEKELEAARDSIYESALDAVARLAGGEG